MKPILVIIRHGYGEINCMKCLLFGLCVFAVAAPTSASAGGVYKCTVTQTGEALFPVGSELILGVGFSSITLIAPGGMGVPFTECEDVGPIRSCVYLSMRASFNSDSQKLYRTVSGSKASETWVCSDYPLHSPI